MVPISEAIDRLFVELPSFTYAHNTFSCLGAYVCVSGWQFNLMVAYFTFARPWANEQRVGQAFVRVNVRIKMNFGVK